LPDQLVPIFPTTVLKRRLDGMEEANRQLAAMLLQMEKTEPNEAAGYSTAGGFQTSKELLSPKHPQADNPGLVALKEHIAKGLKDYSSVLVRQECAKLPARLGFNMWGWGVVLRQGNWQLLHVHAAAHVSGVYYVAAPPQLLKPDNRMGGQIAFSDPRPRATMSQLPSQYSAYHEAPVPGDMVLFPSWLEHSVMPFEGPGERICIAFDAKLDFT
jgi:uncharacterized protein (TIGR02466 family)